MTPIEGITPQALWTTIGVLIGLCSIYLLFCKVRSEIRKEQERKKLENQPGNALAKEISQQVIKEFEPRFVEIERKLTNDKAQIELHTRQINELSNQFDSVGKDVKALCHGMLALLNKAKGIGTEEEIDEALRSFTGYLVDK